MKIAYLSTFFENDLRSCGYRVGYFTAQKMAEMGHKVYFISPGKSLKLEINNINPNFYVIKTPGLAPIKFRKGGFGLLDMLYKVYLTLKNNFDIIHVLNGHRPANIIPCLVGKSIHRTIIVAEVWEWLGKGGYADVVKGIQKIKGKYDVWTEERLIRYYDSLIVISSKLKERFKNVVPTLVLHGGADVTSLKEYSLEEARKELGIRQDLFIIGMSNVCVQDHSYNEIFFKSLQKIISEYSNVRLIITSPEPEYISKIMQAYNLKQVLIYPGWVPFEKYNKYLSACNLFVLPLSNTLINQARWPNKFSDYISLNRPVLTNPVGDIKKLMDDYSIGLYCDLSEEGFYRSIKEILDKKIKVDDLNRDSRYVAHKILSFDSRVNQILSLYKELKKTKSKRKGHTCI